MLRNPRNKGSNMRETEKEAGGINYFRRITACLAIYRHTFILSVLIHLSLDSHPRHRMGSPLHPDAKRLRTIIIAFPLLVVTSAILYRRAYLGEEQRRIPRDVTDSRVAHERIGQVGGVPWELQGKDNQEATVDK